MELTRESTPISGDAESPISTFLTPNSKIKALLATLDDNELVISKASARDQLLASMAKPIPSRLKNVNSSEDSDSDSDEEGAKDFISLSKSTGRMAARMQVNSKIRESRSKDVEFREKKKTTETPSNISHISCKASDSSTDDNIDKPEPATPKNKRKRIIHNETPNSNNFQDRVSPSLFIYPHKTQNQSAHTKLLDIDLLPVDPHKNTKTVLNQMERENKQAHKTKISKEKPRLTEEQRNVQRLVDVGGEADESEGETEYCLTIPKRSCRKASKKALEEMNRETQRLIRLQQLAHQPITKKKITKESLLSKFNFRPQHEICPAQQTSSSPVANPIGSKTPYTPPSSPVKTRIFDSETNFDTISSSTKETCKEQGIEDISILCKTQDTAITSSPPVSTPSNEINRDEEEYVLKTQQHKERSKLNPKLAGIHLTEFKKGNECVNDDSDSDLEIINKKSTLQERLDNIFDKIPAKKVREANGFYALKILAQLKSPSSEKLASDKIPISSNQLQISLQQRARQQAAIERKERLDFLKSKGIVIQTSEERERDQADLDDMLSKARDEVEELGKREKSAKKKQCLTDGEPNLDDSSEDEDWREDKNMADEEISESESDDQSVESSSNEEDKDTEFSKEEVLAQNQRTPPTIPADLSQNNDQNEIENPTDISVTSVDDKESDEESVPLQRPPRRKRGRKIISSDESDDSCEEQGLLQNPRSKSNIATHRSKTPSPAAPTSVLRSATKNFIPGLPVFGPAGLGLTQIFTGTMDDSQISNINSSIEQEAKEDGLDIFGKQAPSPSFSLPPSNKNTQINEKNDLSQVSHVSESQDILFQLSQSQTHGSECTVEDTQVYEFPEPTQDIGFAQLTPIKGRFIESSPKRTESLNTEIMEENHGKKRKRKLQRRAPQIASFSDEEKDDQETWQMTSLGLEDDENDIEWSVFDVLNKASKQKKIEKKKIDKKTSEARIMFNEQAEESDDEYAGLGGLSDDQSTSDEDDFDRDMIDDESEKNVDQGEIAAFFADRERANNEKQLEKLYKDITNGTLRRKRGADYELSDSDDDGLARQRHKRREFAKVRKALLADERISMIASNPKSQAFLRAIEDRGCSEDEENFLIDTEIYQENQDTQSQSHTETTSQDEITLKCPPSKLKETDDKLSGAALQPSRDACRLTAHKKPSNLSEIRHNLSFLLDEPDPIEMVEIASESDDNLEIVDLESNAEKVYEKKLNGEKSDPFALRNDHSTVIDRISLKRNSSASSISDHSHLVYNPKSTSTIGFSVPPLFRQSSGSNTSIISTRLNSNLNSNGVMSKTERETGSESQGIKRGGMWGSGVNYSLQENERCSKITKAKIRRDRKLLEGAKSRKSFLNGLLGAGTFE